MKEKVPWKLNEIVVLAVLSIALGVLFWGWTFVSALASPLSAFGLNYLLAGMWLAGGTLIPFIIRKPGAALLGELLASVIEGFITQWGITAAIWGLAQGLGSELVFAATGYRRYDLKVMIAASMAAAVLSYALDFFYSQFWTLKPWIWPVQLGSFLIGGAFWSGFAAYRIGKGIIRTGAAQNLRSGNE